MLKVANSVIDASRITGVLPVVNGGTGVTTSTGTGNTVLSAAPTLSGNVTLSTGNLIQGTAAKGMNFTANTPAAGMTSQLLNWYEEGSFTMTLTGCTTSPTFTMRYVRLGTSVTLTCASAAISGTSNSVNKTLTSVPAQITPTAVSSVFSAFGQDGASGNLIAVVGIINTAGNIIFYPTPGYGNWTASGTFYLEKFTVSYCI